MVRLRVAQMGDHQPCIDAHTKALKAQGESDERIQQIKSWRESTLYDARERAALAVSEVLGSNLSESVPKDIVCNARAHFNDEEILQLTVAIFAVNDWIYLCAR